MSYNITLHLEKENIDNYYSGSCIDTSLSNLEDGKLILKSYLFNIFRKDRDNYFQYITLNTEFNNMFNYYINLIGGYWYSSILDRLNSDDSYSKSGEITFSGWEYSSNHSHEYDLDDQIMMFKKCLWTELGIIPMPDVTDKDGYYDCINKIDSIIDEYSDIIYDCYSHGLVDKYRNTHNVNDESTDDIILA